MHKSSALPRPTSSADRGGVLTYEGYGKILRVYGILLRVVVVVVLTLLILNFLSLVVGYYWPCDLPWLAFGYYEEPC